MMKLIADSDTSKLYDDDDKWVWKTGSGDIIKLKRIHPYFPLSAVFKFGMRIVDEPFIKALNDAMVAEHKNG